MAKLRVHNFSISLDGYGAALDQSLENPMGIGGQRNHEWAFATRGFHQMQGIEGGDTGLDDDFIAAGEAGIGATVMGRNMFGPIRGEWPDDEWKGWWGDNPPYHHPVFVITHYPREPIAMQGGTTFNFVPDLETAIAQAFGAAGGQDVRVGGGVSTVQQCLRAGLIDEMHLAISPVLLGSGERLFDNLEGALKGYKVVEFISSPGVVHARLGRISTPG
ncbi:MAG: dihydrofolate reductase family protein [Tepidiformaceae bacterium]